MNIEVNVSGVELSSIVESDTCYGSTTLADLVAKELAVQYRQRVASTIDLMVQTQLAPMVRQFLESRFESGGIEKRLKMLLANNLQDYIKQAIEGEVGKAAADFVVNSLNDSREK